MTETARLSQVVVPTTSNSGTIEHSDVHSHHRRFIGPLPERVIAHMVDQTAQTPSARHFPFLHRAQADQHDHDHDHDAGVRAAIRAHALQFFLGHGGREEDWGESQERSVREEMYRRWRQSEWGRAREQRREARQDKLWVGTSFDVGVFLGIDVMGTSHPTQPMEPLTPDASTLAAGTSVVTPTEAETFVTARPILSEAGRSSGYLSSHADGRPASPDSSAPLMEAPPIITVNDAPWHSDSSKSIPSSRAVIHEDAIPSTSSSDPAPKSKGKMVHYADEQPAPPHEVLTRTGDQVDDTSAGAAFQATAENQVNWGDTIMRDRMLVQVSFTNIESLAANFDENQNRTTPHIRYATWKEYIVAWRKDRLELYTDHSIPCKEWLTGHKYLAYVIPLSDSATKLSLYSFTDFTFCITCPPKPLRARSGKTSHLLLYGTTRGTNIFIFNVRPRTRAVDWMWQLWHHLGGQLPLSVDIRCPTLDTRVKVDIPGEDQADLQQAFAIFTPGNTIKLCRKVLRTFQDYEDFIARAQKEGKPLALAWRMDTKLDWIWQADDVEGKARDWAVLYGLALKQGKQPAHLELRLQDHQSSRVRLQDGTRLDEPPGLEGYLDRIRPASQRRQPTYLSTHNGYIFFSNAAQSLPPPPPGTPHDQDNDDTADFRRREVLRGSQQVLRAGGMMDLRSVAAVRRAFQLVPVQMDDVPVPPVDAGEDAEDFWVQAETTEDDHEDVGGAEGLSNASDKMRRHTRRSFELLLSSGRVIRFETYSCQHALEWIARLRPLVSYWKKRHQADAKLEMDLLQASTGRPRITPQRHVDDEEDVVPESQPHLDESAPELSSLYNWCVLLDCRPINKCGRLFSRKGLRGQYKHVQLILVSGHLVEFHITSTSQYFKRGKIIRLLDAYVCSGYFAAQRLPEGQYDPDSPPLARRYQDGLESDDRDEDTLFMVWWYAGNSGQPADSPKNLAVPSLSAKRHTAVFRTRSKLERDAWVWAIRSEVEKAVRATKEREDAIRATGELLET